MDFNELKDKLLSTLGQATDGARDLAGKTADGAKSIVDAVADKAKSGGRIAKLSMDVTTAREEVKKTYLEIGKLYYDTHKDTPEGFFTQLFEEVRIAEENIASMEAELAELKESFKEGFPEVSVEITRDEDFADVVDQAEAEAAGVAEEVKDAVEEKAEDVKEAVEETVEGVKDAVGDAAEKAEELKKDLTDGE